MSRPKNPLNWRILKNDKGGYRLQNISHPSRTQEVAGVTKQIQKALYPNRKQVMDEGLSHLYTRHGTDVHEQIDRWIKTGERPASYEADYAIQLLTRSFPPSQWDYLGEVPISDFYKYASSADIVAVNKTTNEVHIIDTKTGKPHTAAEAIQLNFYKKMFEKTYPDKKVAGLHVLGTNEIRHGLFPQPTITDERLQSVFYNKRQNNMLIKMSDKYEAEQQLHYSSYLYKFLPKATSTNSNDFIGKQITVIDAETGHQREKLSVSALKVAWNKRTNRLEVIDSKEFWFKPTNISSSEYMLAKEVHGISPAIAKAQRELAGAKYSEVYDDSIRDSLVSFIGHSIVAGQNIVNFDMPTLFGLDFGPLAKNQFLDSFLMAQNLKETLDIRGIPTLYGTSLKTTRRDLDTLFQVVTGQTMEQYGLPHHVSFADVIASAIVTQGILEGKFGEEEKKAAWYMITHGVGSIDVREDYVKDSILRTGNMNVPGLLSEYIGKEVYMSINDPEARRKAKERRMNETGVGGLDDPNLIQKENASTTSVRDLYTDIRDAHLKQDIVNAYEKLIDIIEPHYSAVSKQKLAAYAKSLRWAERDDLEKLTKLAGYDVGMTDMENAQKAWERADIAQTEQRTFNEKIGSKKARILELAGEGVISKEQAKGFLDLADFAMKNRSQDSLGNLIDAMKSLTDTTKRLEEAEKARYKFTASVANIPRTDYNSLYQTQYREWNGILGAARGVVPDSVLSIASRYGAIAQNVSEKRRSVYNLVMSVEDTWSGAAGAGLDLAGTKVPFIKEGMQIARMGLGVARGIQGTAIAAKKYNIIQKGETAQAVLNTIGLVKDVALLPLQVFSKALRFASGMVNRFGGVLSGLLGSLGTPLTQLTGVNYPAYQGLQAAERMIGLSNGTLNSSYNNFASSQMALYTLGEVDTGRMVAASLLGQFGNVYTPGDSKSQYTNMVNSLSSRLSTASAYEQKRIMMLAGKIDASLPQTLQVMNDLQTIRPGIKYEDLTNPGYWTHYRGISDTERARMRVSHAQYEGHISSFRNSGRRLMNTLWESGGNEIFQSLNVFLDKLSQNTDVIKGLLTPVKQLASWLSTKADAWGTKINEWIDKTFKFENGQLTITLDMTSLKEHLRNFTSSFLSLMSAGLKDIITMVSHFKYSPTKGFYYDDSWMSDKGNFGYGATTITEKGLEKFNVTNRSVVGTGGVVRSTPRWIRDKETGEEYDLENLAKGKGEELRKAGYIEYKNGLSYDDIRNKVGTEVDKFTEEGFTTFMHTIDNINNNVTITIVTDEKKIKDIKEGDSGTLKGKYVNIGYKYDTGPNSPVLSNHGKGGIQ